MIVQFLVALIGLGIAIDYALLVVVRWREERQQPGMTNDAAVRNAMQHAGSAVVFSGTTVAISLLALACRADPSPAQHRDRGPADRARQRRRRHHAPAGRARDGRARLDWPRNRRDAQASRGWSAWARLVVRHRWVAATAPSLAVLVALVVAALSIQLGNPRADSLAHDGPARSAAREASRTRASAPARSRRSTRSSARATPTPSPDLARRVEGVRSAAAPPDWRRDGTALVTVGSRPRTETRPRAARRSTAPRTRPASSAEVTIGGEAAQSADFLDAVYSNFPLLIGLISALTFVLLARAFRSLILPLKAVLLNLLSVAAAWGLIVLVWQNGFGSDEIWGIEATRAINVADADRRLRLPVRHLDGLPGVHHQPDARGLRPHRFDADRRSSRASAAPDASSRARR